MHYMATGLTTRVTHDHHRRRTMGITECPKEAIEMSNPLLRTRNKALRTGRGRSQVSPANPTATHTTDIAALSDDDRAAITNAKLHLITGSAG